MVKVGLVAYYNDINITIILNGKNIKTENTTFTRLDYLVSINNTGTKKNADLYIVNLVNYKLL